MLCDNALSVPFAPQTSESMCYRLTMIGGGFFDVHTVFACQSKVFWSILCDRTNGRHWFTLLRLHHISGGERLCLKSYWSGSSAFTLTGLHKQLSSKQSWTSNCGSCKIILDPAIYILMFILQITANVIHGTSGGAADCLELGCKMQWDASIFYVLGLLLLSSPIP